MSANRFDHSWFFRFTLALLASGVFVGSFLIKVAHAQITLDGSLGPAGALTGPNFTIPSSLGQTRGGNLFHSFGLFNILTGQSATFTGPNSISNIFGRVTGGQASVIDGLLRSTIPAANLYLLNPAGMLFGPNAALDVKGSFHATTADYLKFADGAKFHADLTRQSILTSAPVSAFGFLSQNPEGIAVLGSALEVPTGQTLSLVGGDVNVVGDPFLTSFGIPTLSAPGGKIQLASVAAPGEVPVNIRDVNLSGFSRLGQVNIFNSALLNTSGNGGGSVVIRGGKLLVDGASNIQSNTFGDLAGDPVGIDIEVTGELSLTGGSLLQSGTIGAGNAGAIRLVGAEVTLDNAALATISSGSGQGGDVAIQTQRFAVLNQGIIFTNALAGGAGGSISIEAGESVSISGGSGISAGTDGVGNSGSVTVRAPVVLLSGEGVITANTSSAGNGGNITIETGELALLDGFGLSSVTTAIGAAGAGGNITLNATGSLTIAGASSNRPSGMFTSTVGDGNAGNISLTSPIVLLDGGNVGAFSADALNPNNRGNAGNITVNAGHLTMQNSARISAATAGATTAGAGGDVTIQATGGIFIDGSSAILNGVEGSGAAGEVSIRAPILTIAGPFGLIESNALGSGAGGVVNIDVGTLRLDGGGVIATGSVGSGAGGTINVAANNLVISGNGGLFTDSTSVGPAGNIDILAGQVTLANGAQISAESQGVGNTGNINVTANSLRSSGSSITTKADTADGGNIHLKVGSLVELVDSQITATVKSGVGSGGNITIDPTFVVLNHSQISANAFGGPGGNITIVADVFLASPDSRITASSALSTPGTVDIQAPITDLSGSLAPLPENILQAASLLRQSCAARFAGGKLSTLVVGARDGLPLEPGGFMPSPLYRLAEQSDRSITQGSLGIDSFQLASASAKPRFSLNGPCTK